MKDAAQGVAGDVPQDAAQDLAFGARAARALSALPLVAFNAIVWKYFDVEVADTAADIGVTAASGKGRKGRSYGGGSGCGTCLTRTFGATVSLPVRRARRKCVGANRCAVQQPRRRAPEHVGAGAYTKEPPLWKTRFLGRDISAWQFAATCHQKSALLGLGLGNFLSYFQFYGVAASSKS